MREAGFYWVKRFDDVWVVAEQCREGKNGYWHFSGSENVFFDHELQEINETRLIAPDEVVAISQWQPTEPVEQNMTTYGGDIVVTMNGSIEANFGDQLPRCIATQKYATYNDLVAKLDELKDGECYAYSIDGIKKPTMFTTKQGIADAAKAQKEWEKSQAEFWFGNPKDWVSEYNTPIAEKIKNAISLQTDDPHPEHQMD